MGDDIYYNNDNLIPRYTKTNRVIFDRSYAIKSRYEILDSLGAGAFSNVYKCYDHKNIKKVAVKVIKNNNKFNKSYKTEIEVNEILNKLNNKNILNMFEHFIDLTHKFLVFEIWGDNLYTFYKSNNNYDYLDFGYQILSGLSEIHKYQIIHADLKPENILIKDNILKICDFGSSFFEKDQKYYTYIQSRYYRSSDVILNKLITCKADVWSFACILYELYYKKPLFLAYNYKDLILKIIRLIGYPNDYYINEIPSTYIHIKENIDFSNKIIENILKLCLTWEYNDRLSSKELLLQFPKLTNLKK